MVGKEALTDVVAHFAHIGDMSLIKICNVVVECDVKDSIVAYNFIFKE